MNARRHYTVNILATGVLVAILTLTALFWARYFCSMWRASLMPSALRTVVIRPSGLSPWDVGPDANRVSPSSVMAQAFMENALAGGLGIERYMHSRLPMGILSPDSPIYLWELRPESETIYYDPSLGQMVHTGTRTDTRLDGSHVVVHFTDYAGPEGMAPAPDEKLGRFDDPIADRFTFHPWVVCDRDPGRFFVIDWQKRTVRKGSWLFKSDVHRPVQIGSIRKNPRSLSIEFGLPTYRDSSGRTAGDLLLASGVGLDTSFRMVLDASGRIDVLNMDTLELAVGTMRLVAPASLFPGERSGTPKDMAAYCVEPAFVYSPQGRGQWLHAGTAVATLSRDATTARLEVFDPNGKRVAMDYTSLPQYVRTGNGDIRPGNEVFSGQAAYFHLPGAQVATLARFLAESLHPPALLFLSYFTGPRSEATAGCRSLLVPVDSFLAMMALSVRDSPDRGIVMFLLMAPTLFVAGLLSERVARDADRIGLARSSKKKWVLGTILFGLPVYLTYRLTRPKVTLVTCANCGLTRRPDMDKCHHCGSVWAVPELIPPAWRVLGEPEQAEATSPSLAREEETGSPAKEV